MSEVRVVVTTDQVDIDITEYIRVKSFGARSDVDALDRAVARVRAALEAY